MWQLTVFSVKLEDSVFVCQINIKVSESDRNSNLSQYTATIEQTEHFQ